MKRQERRLTLRQIYLRNRALAKVATKTVRDVPPKKEPGQ